MAKKVLWLRSSALALAFGCATMPAHAQTAGDTAPSAAPVTEDPLSESEAGGSDIPDIVVTAQRRSQRLQDTPVVVAVVSAAALDLKGIASTSDLSTLAPGITTFTANGFVMPSLRGVGSQINAAGSSGTVAIYLDGVYIASPQAALFGLNNIEQVEVDKGPQGTLFGRNATAGVIQITTRDPSRTFTGRISAGVANYETLTGSLYLSGPLTSTLAADIAVHGSYQGDGWGTNVYTGKDNYISRDWSVRSKLLWQPGADTRVLATVDYSYVKDSMATIHTRDIPYNAGVPGLPLKLQSQLGDPWNTFASLEPNTTGKQWGASLEIEQDLGGARLTNIAAYRRSDNVILSPSNIPPYDANSYQVHVYEQTSEELRLASPTASPIAWVLGFYYLNSTATNEPYTFTNAGSASFTSSTCTARRCPPYFPLGALAQALGTIPIPPEIGGFPANSAIFNTYIESKVGSTSYSGFAQATAPLDFIAPSLNLTAGLRWTSETVTSIGSDRLRSPGVVFTQPDTNFKKLTYKVGLDYRFTPDVMGYVSFSRGFQAGFFNANTPRSAASAPQTIDDLEFGIKSTFFDRKLTFNVGAFYYDYKNIVANVVIAGIPNTTNGPAAELYGLDADLTVALGAFRMTASAEYLHSKFTSFANATTALPAGPTLPNGICRLILCNPFGGVVNTTINATGNQLPYAPEFAFNVSPSYNLPLASGELLIGGDWYHNSGYYNDASNTFRQNAYDTFGAYLQWKPGNGDWALRVWGKNLSNEAIYARMSTTAPFGEFYALAAPRTFGVSLDYRF